MLGRWAVFALGALVVALAAMAYARPVALAANFTVDSETDAVDANPGDGTCATAAGACTLRAAVQESSMLPGADSITLPAGVYALTLPGNEEEAGLTGDLDIYGSVTITGAGADTTTIDGGGLDRVLQIQTGGSAEISGVTVTGGGNSLEAGGILAGGSSMELRDAVLTGNFGSIGGGLVNRGVSNAMLDNVTITENTSGHGGGIFNVGSLTMTDSAITWNDSDDDGGAVVNHGTFVAFGSTFDHNASGDNGGAFWQDGTMTINNSTIRDNTTSDEAGAVANFSGGHVTINHSEVARNHAFNGRAALLNLLSSFMVVRDSTLADNTSSQDGGALTTVGQLTVTNSTLEGNNAASHGGGLFVSPAGIATLENVTIANNTSEQGAAIYNAGIVGATNVTFANNTSSMPFSGGIVNTSAAAVESSIISGNTPVDCANTAAMASVGYNLDESGTCGLAATGDVTGIDPMLGALVDNGGPTMTMALLAGSPAIDTGSLDCPPPGNDQRYFGRPAGVRCDMGAYEYQAVALPTLTPTRTSTPTATRTPTGVAGAAGDADCSGTVNSIDAAIVLQADAGLLTAVPCPAAADVNGDGRIDARDAALILQFVAGLIDSLPV